MKKVLEKLGYLFLGLKEFFHIYKKPIRTFVVSSVILIAVFYQAYLRAPSDFPEDKMVHIEKGSSLNAIALSLEDIGVIKSPLVFKLSVLIFSGSTGSAMAGDYIFSEPMASPRIASRLVNGEFNLTPVKITIPEGTTINNISTILSKAVPSFNSEAFLKETKDKEGYLFPDTYFFFPNVSTEQVVKDMENNFDKKIETLRDDISRSGHTTREIVIMASLLEHEAHTTDDRKIIAGILWKRINIGMPLQVDAPFIYDTGKNTYQLTTKDLKTDSPYNTYTRKGLPAGPIGNPGLDSILAAIYPKDSPYLYYLSDREGNVYYSATFDKHKRNKVLYIN